MVHKGATKKTVEPVETVEPEVKESAEVTAAREAQARAKADAIANAKAREASTEAQRQKNIDGKRESGERVARKLEKAEEIRKKKAKARAEALEKELSTPLTPAEKEEMLDIEKRANRGKNQPHSSEMHKLSKYRIRSKLKGTENATRNGEDA